ncbi:MAG: MBL fold metallo-hydrolase [Verrucomicrobiota bacterium]
MGKQFFLLLTALLFTGAWAKPVHGQNSQSTNEAALAELLGNTDTKSDAEVTPERGTLLQWFGHAFIYLTSDSGIRIAINPFSDGIFDYTFPSALPADIVLISCESADYSGGKELFGLPQVFRSLAGVGLNNANGLTFRGIATFRDKQRGRELGSNTVYSFVLDGIRYCHLGAVGHTLDFRQRSKIGKVDVLFLPVGNPILSESELWSLADSLKAKWIVPIVYKTDKSRSLVLRKLEDFDFKGAPTRNIENSRFVFQENALPESPTFLILKTP